MWRPASGRSTSSTTCGPGSTRSTTSHCGASCKPSTCSPTTGRASGGLSSTLLFAFDPWRDSILLVAGDKSGRWNQWYREAIPLAEQRYEGYLKDRRDEEERQT
ncbi:type II toxin-antitoxin system RelE/ParE family toxin [Actinomycetospora endophytica]|uniref:type II toxin-antitoxin system RelE/ParE family toxin n=1 Tax=Actinomycetospora endophytica TaxID=2291215 RepID=UPI0027E2FB85|nr:type II toxin-antitoxin system RelE/ParE family toxin [Actinomycetospora endophytica]